MTKLPLALAMASFIPSAIADTNSLNSRIEEVIIVSTRTETPYISQGTSFSVIPAQQLQHQGFDSLADHLTTQVGIDVRQSGGLGSQTGVFIRGEESFRTQLRVDGLKIVDPSGTQAAPIFDSILLGGLNRIEILRGPQGAVYGADAGGVVSVTSKDYNNGPEVAIDLRGGSDNYRRLLGTGGTGGDWGQLSVSTVALDTDGFNARVSDQTKDDDGYENQTIHAKGEINLGQLWQLGAVLRQHEGEVEYDSCFPSSNNCLSETDLNAGLVSVSINHDLLRQALSVSRTASERQDFTDGVPSFDLEGDIERVEYLGQLRLSKTFNLIYGIDYENETVADTDREQKGIYLTYHGRFNERFNLNASIRYDDSEEFGSFSTHRVAVNAELINTKQGRLIIKSSVGTGFRAPSLNEQSYNDGSFAFGDAAGLQLEEETSEGIDAALQWFGNAGLFASIGAFYQTVDDQILFASDFSGYLQDFGESNSQGIELEVNWVINSYTTISGNYTYNETEDTNGDQRIRRPKHLANFGFTVAPLEDLEIYANYQIVQDAISVSSEPLEDYALLNTSIDYSVSPKLDVYLNLENLLDEDYQQIDGFNTQGVAIYLGGRVNF